MSDAAEMRAWRVTAAGEPIDVLDEATVPVPAPGPGQLRLRVSAAGIGLPDVLMCRGSYPLTPPLPFTPGQEATGVVTAVGEGVQRQVGDRVMVVTTFYQGTGAFAEQCLALDDTSFAVPDRLTDVEAAGFWIPHSTAWTGLVERGHLAEGEWLAVLGAAGGSGIAAVQLGRALGAHVVAVVSSEEKATYCRDLGAEAVLVAGDAPVGPVLRELTGGHGVDVVYDPVGGELAEQAATALARNGRLLAVGFASGRWPSIQAHDLVITNSSLVGVFAGGHTAAGMEAMQAGLAAMVADGRLRPTISATTPFADLPEALQRVADRQVLGKLVVVP